MTLQTWIIEPRDSLIVRDGKPFGANVTHAVSLDFPFPSTTTGGVRTRMGLNQDGVFDYPKDKLNELKEIFVFGALLVGLNPENNQIGEFYINSPADALLVQNENQRIDKKVSIKRLFPMNLVDSITNLPKDLMPVGLTKPDTKVKPYKDLRFWKWEFLKDWLKDGKEIDDQNPNDYGIPNLQKDSRVHVGINDNLASEEGNLFQTRGLEFNYGNGDLKRLRKFALAVFIDSMNGEKLQNKGTLGPLGGERRIVTWSENSQSLSILHCPDEIKRRIVEEKYCRLMLLTPAYFEDIFSNLSRVNYEVKAIVCDRYQTVSGWDFENKCPKPTRRLIPAGSILFLKITSTDIANWVDDTWFSCIGDDSQAKTDGFGLSVLGTWDGKTLDKWEAEK